MYQSRRHVLSFYVELAGSATTMLVSGRLRRRYAIVGLSWNNGAVGGGFVFSNLLYSHDNDVTGSLLTLGTDVFLGDSQVSRFVIVGTAQGIVLPMYFPLPSGVYLKLRLANQGTLIHRIGVYVLLEEIDMSEPGPAEIPFGV